MSERTPLFERHVELGGRMVEFAGFSLPVYYKSIVDEHRAVRERVAVFDVSHMGQLVISGPGALASTERLLSCRVASLRVGAVRYGLLCNERGGVVDDVTLYRPAEDVFFLCVNAANIDKDRDWIADHLGRQTELEDQSRATGMLALQGPASAKTLLPLCERPALVEGLRRFRFVDATVAGARCRVSRTGYTGSDGFEIYAPAESLAALFDALREAGEPLGLEPAGLGARDTLRLEAALALYGHELDDSTSPLEAGLDRFVKLDEGGFIGAEAIASRAAAGHTRALVGFVLGERGVARANYELVAGTEADAASVGRVTSGAPSPTLGKSIGLGYLLPELARPGTEIAVQVRDRRLRATVTPTPFVQ